MPFRNEIVWKGDFSSSLGKVTGKLFAHDSDTIYFYTKTNNYYFDKPFDVFTDEQLRRYRKVFDDNDGKGPYYYKPLDSSVQKTIDRYKDEKRFRAAGDGNKAKVNSFKCYIYESKGKPVSNIWTDINRIVSTAKERCKEETHNENFT